MDHLEHRGAHDERELAVEGETEGQCRQHEVDADIGRLIEEALVAEEERVRHADCREEAAEQDEQHQAEELRREGVERHGEVRARLVEFRAAAPGGEDAGEDTDDDGEHGSDRDHRHGVLQIHEQQVGDGLLGDERDPHVPVDELA